MAMQIRWINKFSETIIIEIIQIEALTQVRIIADPIPLPLSFAPIFMKDGTVLNRMKN